MFALPLRVAPTLLGWCCAWALATAAGCAFDDSRLASRCAVDDECGAGSCVQGFCTTVIDTEDPDGGVPFDPDARADDGGALPDGGGQPDEGGAPDSPALPDVADEPPCPSPNACGGCGVLPATPGTACSTATCGQWTCEGANLRCLAGAANGCGGCTPLGGTPGDACGACEGNLVCDGMDALACLDDGANACGGCGGEPGDVGAPCGCGGAQLAEQHVVSCLVEQAICADTNGDLGAATRLPDTTDVMQEPASAVGVLIEGDGVDWYLVNVEDLASEDGMFPDVGLTGLASDHDLCAFFVYATGDLAEIDCASGSSATRAGLPGCCSTNPANADELVRLRNGSLWSERLDTSAGAGNDDAIIYIEVTGTASTECAPYELRYQF